MSADGTFFIRLLRVKTAQEQGLALVPDSASFVVCPLFALATALAVQGAPSPALLSQLPALVTPAAIVADDAAPLYALLDADVVDLEAVAVAASARRSDDDTGDASGSGKKNKLKAEIGVHGYINRLLKCLSPPRPVTEKLTSHSFRRGGAQHANGDDRLSAQWIFDRGGWNMSTTNKGFAYVFNTPREDRKVARVLSGWAPEKTPAAAEIGALDARAQEGLGRLQTKLFASCSGHAKQEVNVDSKSLRALTAVLVVHYPRVKALSENAPLVRRLEECTVEAGCEVLQLLAWSAALELAARDGVAVGGMGVSELSGCAGKQEREQASGQASCASEHSAAIVAELIAMNRKLSERLRVCESALMANTAKRTRAHEEPVHEEAAQTSEQPPKRRKNAAAASPSSIWYEWFTRVPRLWESGDKQRHSAARLVVVYLKLFLPDGFELRESSVTYKDEVVAVGAAAEAALLAYLRARDVRATSYGTVLREMRKIHHSGALNEHIATYRLQRAADRAVDPSPQAPHDVLMPRFIVEQ